MKKYIISILIINILVLGFPWQGSLAQEPPETLEEAKEVGEEVLKGLPGAIKKVWQEEALPVWRKMWEKAKDLWDGSIGSWVKDLWQKFLNLLGKEVEKRKPDLEEEFQKEKQEIQKELPKIRQSFWKRFKGLLE